MTGVTVGAGCVLVRALGWPPLVMVVVALTAATAIIGANVSMASPRSRDPRTWTSTDLVADLVPHMAYGFVAAMTATGH